MPLLILRETTASSLVEILKETFSTILMLFSLPVQVNLPFIAYSSWIWLQVSITNLVSYSQQFCRSTKVQKVFHIVQLLLVLSDQVYVSAELLFVQDLSSQWLQLAASGYTWSFIMKEKENWPHNCICDVITHICISPK